MPTFLNMAQIFAKVRRINNFCKKDRNFSLVFDF